MHGMDDRRRSIELKLGLQHLFHTKLPLNVTETGLNFPCLRPALQLKFEQVTGAYPHFHSIGGI